MGPPRTTDRQPFLGTVFGRRLFAVFTLCVLLPTTALALLAFFQVSSELYDQSRERLQRAAKTVGMALLQRLVRAEDELAALELRREGAELRLAHSRRELDGLASRLRAVSLESAEGAVTLWGEASPWPAPTPRALAHLSAGRTELLVGRAPGGGARVALRRPTTTPDGEPVWLRVELRPEALFAIAEDELLPLGAGFCAFDASDVPLACSEGAAAPRTEVLEGLRSEPERFSGWAHDGEAYLIRSWELFLGAAFAHPDWTVVVFEPRSVVLAPVARFRATFPLLMALLLCGAGLAGIRLIRRRLAPLDRLREGTERLARRDFSARVEVASQDEFQGLADSFNAMAGELEEHIRALGTLLDVARELLAAETPRQVVARLLARLGELYACDAVTVALVEVEDGAERLVATTRADDAAPRERVGPAPDEPERRAWAACPDWLVVDLAPGDLPVHLAALAGLGLARAVVLPLHVHGSPAGVLCLGHRSDRDPDAAHLIYARQVADQTAVALAALRARQENRALAYTDALTGLANRALFEEGLAQAVAAAGRLGGSLAVCLLDLDAFRRINETLGPAQGDLLLREVGERIRPLGGEHVARLGGDEFGVLLPGLAQVDDAARTAQRLIDALARPLVLPGGEVFVTASVGIALHPFDGAQPDRLIRSAEVALRHAKQRGRGQYAFYTGALDTRSRDRLTLEAELRRALERGELRVFYQPVVDLDAGGLVGVEALVRWFHPRLGTVSPGEFVPLAEETGLVVALGEQVLRTACADASAWQRDGLPALRVNVNLARAQLAGGELLDTVSDALARAGLEPRWLGLEVTESELVGADETTLRTLHQLRVSGVKLYVDDFGTGYSSLAYLKQFPFDALKIDQSFIRGVPGDARDASIVRAVVSMGRGLGLEVIAEGVEREEQRAFLAEVRCSAAQGFLFAKPLPEGEFRKRLAEWPAPGR